MTSMITRLERSVRRRIQLALVLVIGMVFMIGVFVLQPEYSRASDAWAEVSRLERESTSIGATESRLTALEAEKTRRKTIEMGQIRDIPKGADESGLADTLALSVDDGGANAWSVRLLEPESLDAEAVSGKWMALPAVIEMEGRFSAVVDALRRVENSDRLVRVRMIRVARPRSGSGGLDTIDATVELDTIFVAEEAK